MRSSETQTFLVFGPKVQSCFSVRVPNDETETLSFGPNQNRILAKTCSFFILIKYYNLQHLLLLIAKISKDLRSIRKTKNKSSWFWLKPGFYSIFRNQRPWVLKLCQTSVFGRNIILLTFLHKWAKEEKKWEKPMFRDSSLTALRNAKVIDFWAATAYMAQLQKGVIIMHTSQGVGFLHW